jgi:hypothetical protein
MFVRFPVWAFVAIVAGTVLGTDRIGRAFTHEEKRALSAELRKHDYEGARLVALRFAYRLTRDRERARELMDRVDNRLVRLGWDSAAISLPRYLCRLTWSEWTHAVEEQDRALAKEGAFLRDRRAIDGMAAPSVEERAADVEAKTAAEARARAALEKLRAWFEAEGDVVNLIWLDAALQQEGELPDAQTLSAQTGRAATEFYAAAKRRKRAVARVLGAE